VAKKLFTWIIVLAIIGAIFYLPGTYTVVRKSARIIVLKKSEFSLSQVYVDVTDWTPVQYLQHPALTKALIEQGFKDMMEQVKSK